MAQLERIGVSLDKELLSKFDDLISKQGYGSRSEAIRDLVRRQLSEERLQCPKARAVPAGDFFYARTPGCTRLPGDHRVSRARG